MVKFEKKKIQKNFLCITPQKFKKELCELFLIKDLSDKKIEEEQIVF